MRTHLNRTLERARRSGTRGEDGRPPCQRVHLQIGHVTDPNRAGFGVDRRHVARATVGPRPGDPQALSLPDGETVHAVMGGQHRTGRVHHCAATNPYPLAQKRLGVARRNETDVVAIRLVGHRQAAPGRLFPNLRLGGVPIGNIAWRSCSAVSTAST